MKFFAEAIRAINTASNVSVGHPSLRKDDAVLDLKGLQEDLEKAVGKDGAHQVVVDIIEKTAYEIQRLMKWYAPVKTGALRDSIQVKITKKGLQAEIYTKIGYGKYLEYGTASRGEFGGTPYVIMPKKPGGTLAFQGSSGGMVYAKKVIHPGIAPRPFARPAVIQATDIFQEQIAEGVVNLLINTRTHKEAKNRHPNPEVYTSQYSPEAPR